MPGRVAAQGTRVIFIPGNHDEMARQFGALAFGGIRIENETKNAVLYISRFEEALAAEARRKGVDGVVCGHIHKAEIRVIDGILYCNDGDWVDSLSALTLDRGDVARFGRTFSWETATREFLRHAEQSAIVGGIGRTVPANAAA